MDLHPESGTPGRPGILPPLLQSVAHSQPLAAADTSGFLDAVRRQRCGETIVAMTSVNFTNPFCAPSSVRPGASALLGATRPPCQGLVSVPGSGREHSKLASEGAAPPPRSRSAPTIWRRAMSSAPAPSHPRPCLNGPSRSWADALFFPPQPFGLLPCPAFTLLPPAPVPCPWADSLWPPPRSQPMAILRPPTLSRCRTSSPPIQHVLTSRSRPPAMSGLHVSRLPPRADVPIPPPASRPLDILGLLH